MLNTNARRPSSTDPAWVKPRPQLPGFIDLEELAQREERRYIDTVSSIFFRDLPANTPHLTERWEALLNQRIRVARDLRMLAQHARSSGVRWTESMTRALKRNRDRLHALDREEWELVTLGLYREPNGK